LTGGAAARGAAHRRVGRRPERAERRRRQLGGQRSRGEGRCSSAKSRGDQLACVKTSAGLNGLTSPPSLSIAAACFLLRGLIITSLLNEGPREGTFRRNCPRNWIQPCAAIRFTASRISRWTSRCAGLGRVAGDAARGSFLRRVRILDVLICGVRPVTLRRWTPNVALLRLRGFAPADGIFGFEGRSSRPSRRLDELSRPRASVRPSVTDLRARGARPTEIRDRGCTLLNPDFEAGRFWFAVPL